jgi:YggT family protein
MHLILSYIAGVLVIFLSLIEYIIIIEIILSWLVLFGIRVRIGFFVSVTGPLYTMVRRYLPTTLGPLDFTPLIILLAIQFLTSWLMPFTPLLF